MRRRAYLATQTPPPRERSTRQRERAAGRRLRSGLQCSEVPGRAPSHTERVIPHRYVNAAGVVLCRLEVGNQAESGTAVHQHRVSGGVGSVTTDRVTTTSVDNGRAAAAV